MKKIFLLVAMVLFSVSVFAEGRSCTVYNANNLVATIENSTCDVNSNNGSVSVGVSLNANAPRDIKVVVNVYTITGTYLTSKTITIQANTSYACESIKVNGINGRRYEICMFKINSASCQ